MGEGGRGLCILSCEVVGFHSFIELALIKRRKPVVESSRPFKTLSMLGDPVPPYIFLGFNSSMWLLR